MSMPVSIIAMAAAAAADVAEKGASGAESGGLPQLDTSTWPSQIFWLIVTFGFLYWVMSAYILPRVGGMIEERRDRIADDLDQASEFRHQAEDAEAAYNTALADAKAKAHSIAADTRDKLDSELAEMQADADAKATAAVEAAERRIAEMKKDATTKVQEAAIDTTRSVVEILIDERPTDDAIASAMKAS